MKKILILLALTGCLAPIVAWSQLPGRESPLRVRYYVAKVPTAADGGMVQVGVTLPAAAKVASTQVFVDSQDLGARKTWAKCDVASGSCDIGDSEIIRFHRDRLEDRQELAVDIRNRSDEIRYAKIVVVFQPQSGRDRSGCGRKADCGFARPVSAD